MIWPLIKGLALTLKYTFSKSVTIQYPEERPEIARRWRGRHLLLRHENGRIRCVACMLCATVCPSQCIYIEPGEDEEGKYPEIYRIDLGRCIFCGLCVEACPKDAITMTTKSYELAEYSREALILDKERLLQFPKTT
jgi:NADH-quinone oxidoreductase chain I